MTIISRCKWAAVLVAAIVMVSAQPAYTAAAAVQPTSYKNSVPVTFEEPFLVTTELAKVPYAQTATWFLTAEKGFILRDPRTPTKTQKIERGTLTVSVSPGRLMINTTPWHAGQILISSLTHDIGINGVIYSGTLLIDHGIDVTTVRVSSLLEAYIEHKYGPRFPLPWLHEVTFLSDLSHLPDGAVQTPRSQRKKSKKEQAVRHKQTALFQVESLEEPAKDLQEDDEFDLNRALVVRVLLKTWPFEETGTTVVTSPQGFTVVAEAATRQIVPFKESELTIVTAGGVTTINGKKFAASKVTVVPENGHLRLGEHNYQGAVQLVQDAKKSTLLIGCVGIEDYLYAVLHSEGWPGWPLEVYKVMAVTSRTYVIFMAREAYRTKRPYHIKNTCSHQVYGGFHTNHHLREAVNQTSGMFLTYNNLPIIAMFDSCCGGLVPANIVGLNYEKAPYLGRTYACTHCKAYPKVYYWSASYSVAELEALLKQQVDGLKKLKDLTIVKKDKAGTVHEVAVKCTSKKNLKIPGKKLYGLLKDVKSFTYAIKKKADTITFEGRGLGHHLGLCQWGAREMVREGWDYQRILRFYYPGTSLMKLA